VIIQKFIFNTDEEINWPGSFPEEGLGLWEEE